MNTRRRAFTLIELLVVVAILSLLMTLLLPSLQQAKKAARKTVCMATLNTIGKTILMYAESNDKHFIPVSNDNNLWTGPPYNHLWFMRVRIMRGFAPYLNPVRDKATFEGRGGKLVICPDDPYYNTMIGGNLEDYSSYAMNIYTCGALWNYEPSDPPDPNNPPYGPKLDDILQLSRTIHVIVGGMRVFAWGISHDYYINGGGVMDTDQWHGAFCKENHNGRADTLFFDGHVASCSLADVSYDTVKPWGNNEGFLRWWGMLPKDPNASPPWYDWWYPGRHP